MRAENAPVTLPELNELIRLAETGVVQTDVGDQGVQDALERYAVEKTPDNRQAIRQAWKASRPSADA